jgi:hypothetical protein
MRVFARLSSAFVFLALAVGTVALVALVSLAAPPTVPRAAALDPREKHFASLTMLTDGGENAEA